MDKKHLNLKSCVDVLESYRGRDKVMRTISYASCLVGGVYLGRGGKNPAAEKFFKLSSEISACRTVLRLFDDLSMLVYSLSYGFGEKVSLGLNQFYFLVIFSDQYILLGIYNI